MQAFEYSKPLNVKEAAAVRREDGDALYLAGGMTLIPTLKQGLAMPSRLIDLNGLAELSGIAEDGQGVRIGAMTRHAEIAGSAMVRARIPALSFLAGGIGDPAVRNRGTLGGSVANADPAADYPAALVALGAMVVTDAREISADDFFTGLFETALDDGEMILSVRFPRPGRAAYAKFPNPASRYAMVGVFVAEHADGVRVAVTGAGASVFRVPDMEQALSADFRPEALASIAIPADGLNADMHGSADYRAHLVGVMARRAVAAALG